MESPVNTYSACFLTIPKHDLSTSSVTSTVAMVRLTKSRRKRKPSLVSSNNAPAVSRKLTQSTIATFHTLLKKRSALERLLQSTPQKQQSFIQQDLANISSQIEDMGGLEAYQRASTLGQSGQRGGNSARMLIKWLKELRSASEWTHSARLLEIGALTPNNYASCAKWLTCYPIDLHSRHPDIAQEDFLQREGPSSDDDRFDIISCSLVLNYVSDAKDRGRMLSLCHSYLRPRPSSLLFMVLPLPCVQNSRYLTSDSLVRLMRGLGFGLVEEQWRTTSKVAYWLWRWEETRNDASIDLQEFSVKTVHRDGPKRNNFAILVA